MKPKKAAELLKQRQAADAQHAETDLYKADQIALQALQLNLKMRENFFCPQWLVLPSEEPE
ncbi:hypothetical protein ES708_30224 [subsurface metagenome]